MAVGISVFLKIRNVLRDPRFWAPKVRLTLLTLATFAALC